jgi:hypothetical protein
VSDYGYSWEYKHQQSAQLWSPAICCSQENKGKVSELIEENQHVTGKWQQAAE